MNDKSSKIKEVIPELYERKNVGGLIYYWSIAISDSKILIFRPNVDYNDLIRNNSGGGWAMMNSHLDRMEDAKRLIGDDIERIIAKMNAKYIFNRQPGAHIKFKVEKKWWMTPKLLLEDDNKMVEKEIGHKPNIHIRSKKLKEFKEAVPELEIEYITE